jgi:hypothetical protein
MVHDTLCGVVPPEMVTTIAKKETTKEVCDEIATMRVIEDATTGSEVQPRHIQ